MRKSKLLNLSFWCGVGFAVIGIAGLLYSGSASNPMWTKQTQNYLFSLQANRPLFYLLSTLGFSAIALYFILIFSEKVKKMFQ